MTKTIAQTYQVLDEIDHIRKRTGMYAGSVSEQTAQEWIYNSQTKKMEKSAISYIPALVKIFSEILDNAIDESRRAPEILDTIRVTFDEDGTISILDNGRGIPVEIHPDTKTYIAETVFSNLRAGSNFNDDEDQQLIGTNGVGSTLSNVLSTSFKIESCDGKKVFKQEFKNGMRERCEPSIKPDTKNRTKITFIPDYAFFKLPGLTEGNRLRMIKKVVDAAACNLSVKFYVNGERIMIGDFDDYVSLYAEDFVTDNTPDWKVGISSSEGFEQVSFVNSVETYQGGTHVLYAVNQITERLREFIKKKHKIDVRPSEIREHMRVYISANINRPKFSSQTKENMISPVSDYKTSWTVSDKMINKIIKSNIIQNILDWAAAKQHQEEMKELRKLNKDVEKTNYRRVEKFCDALEKKDRYRCGIFLSEGDTLDENEPIIILRESESSLIRQEVKLKEVSPGDLVLTHKNRWKPVLSTSPKVIEGVKITFGNETLIISPEHRLIAYDITSKTFCEVKGKDLNPAIHKLVKNRCNFAAARNFTISRIEHEKYHFLVEVDGVDNLYCSETHYFLVLDIKDLQYKRVDALNLDTSKHMMLIK